MDPSCLELEVPREQRWDRVEMRAPERKVLGGTLSIERQEQ